MEALHQFDWQEHENNWLAWYNHELERPMVVLETFKPTKRYQKMTGQYPGVGCPAHFPLDEPVENVLDFFEAQIESTQFFGDSWPRWWPNFGPGIIAGFLGAELDIRQDTIWFKPPDGFDFSRFEIVLDKNNKWYRRVYDLTRAAERRWRNKVNICFTDMGENFDILLHFRQAENLMMDLFERPELIKKYVKEMTQLWIECYEEFYRVISRSRCGTSAWTGLWSPRKHYILQSDFSYMIGPDMFEEFILGDIQACADHLDHPFYHLDGKGQINHLEYLLKIDKLYGIQWIPGDGSGQPEDYPELLKRIIDAGKLCQVYVRPEGAIKIKQELGAKGFAFQIVHDGMNEDAANELLKQLYK